MAPKVRDHGGEQCEKRCFSGVPWIERLAALDGIGHVGYSKRQVWKPLGLTGLEAELGVPALQIDVLADDPNADRLNGVRLSDPNDVLNESGTDTTLAASGKNREAVEVGETGARAFVGNARNRAGVLFGDEVSLAAREIRGNPGVGAERRMLWAVVGVQTEPQRDIAVGGADERCDRGDVRVYGLSDLHWRARAGDSRWKTTLMERAQCLHHPSGAPGYQGAKIESGLRSRHIDASHGLGCCLYDYRLSVAWIFAQVRWNDGLALEAHVEMDIGRAITDRYLFDFKVFLLAHKLAQFLTAVISRVK